MLDYKKELAKQELEQKNFIRKNGKRSFVLDTLIAYFKGKLSN